MTKVFCLSKVELGRGFACLLFLLLCTGQVKSEINDVNSIAWGGGGAFTSVAYFKGEHYLSSDVTGTWKQIDGSWQPFVDGLTNYNVTALTVFNNSLYAITSDELLVTDGKSKWLTTDIKLNTYRGTNDQPYAQSEHLKILCIATRKNAIVCIDQDLNITTINTEENTVTGVFFSEQNQQALFFYANNNVYTFTFSTKRIDLVGTFKSKVVSLADYSGKLLIATTKAIYKIEDLTNTLYTNSSSSIVNFFVLTSQSASKIFISTGNQWNIRLQELQIDSGIFNFPKSVKVKFDESLPHRKRQKALTKFLSLQQAGNEFWLTDYWGVYQLDLSKESVLQEVTKDAVNTVATDLIVTPSSIYISAMDNGVVKLDNLNNKNEPLKATEISSKILNGHGWSMLYFNRTLYAAISPWNKANDYLFAYSEMDASATVTQLSHLEKRESKGAFWSKSYARELVYYNGIVSFKDGYDGGLVQDKKQANDRAEPFTLGKYNKVYKAMAELNGLLYVATCEGPPIVSVLDASGQAQYTIKLPKRFCAYTAYKHQDSIYLLGSQKGESVIYQLKNNRINRFLKADVGSVFYAMEINPENKNEIIVAGFSWSKKATSRLLVSVDGGEAFFDQTCLLTHKNGVAALKIEGNNKPVWILQKVGGLLRVDYESVFNEKRC